MLRIFIVWNIRRQMSRMNKKKIHVNLSKLIVFLRTMTRYVTRYMTRTFKVLQCRQIPLFYYSFFDDIAVNTFFRVYVTVCI